MQVVTNVNAKGVAKADFDTVTFSVTALATGDDGPSAKKALQVIVGNILAAEKTILAEGVVINPDTRRASDSVTPRYATKRGKYVISGYQATYSFTISTQTLDKTTFVQDTLTSLKDVAVEEPVFGIKDAEDLKKQALKDAYDHVASRFATECKVFNVNPDDYMICAWNVNYMDSNRGVSPMGGARVASAPAAAPEAPIEVDPGKAEVTVHLGVSYSLKG